MKRTGLRPPLIARYVGQTVTASQPRGFLPDAVDDDRVILFKASASLRLTYEIRIATFMASSRGYRLLLVVPDHAQFSDGLNAFVAEHNVVVQRGGCS